MVETVWDDMNFLEQTALDDYENIKALFKATPNRKDDPAGQKLEDALKGGKGEFVNKDFATKFDAALKDPDTRAQIANLSPEEMEQNIDALIENPANIPTILANLNPQEKPEIQMAAVEKPTQEPKPENKEASPETIATAPEKAPVALAASEPEPVQVVAAAIEPEPAPAEKSIEQPPSAATATAAPPKPAAAAEPITVAAAVVADKVPATPDDLMKQKVKDLMGEISEAKGFDGFMKRVDENDNLKNAFDHALSDNSSPEKAVTLLENIKERVEKDPEFFNKANEIIDEKPQLVNTFAKELIKDPDVAFDKLDQAMFAQDNPMLASMLSNLGVVGQHLMGILGPLLEILGDVLGVTFDKIDKSMQDFKDKPKQSLTNGDNSLEKSLLKNLPENERKTAPTTVHDGSGQPTAPSPGEAPKQPGQETLINNPELERDMKPQSPDSVLT